MAAKRNCSNGPQTSRWPPAQGLKYGPSSNPGAITKQETGTTTPKSRSTTIRFKGTFSGRTRTAAKTTAPTSSIGNAKAPIISSSPKKIAQTSCRTSNVRSVNCTGASSGSSTGGGAAVGVNDTNFPSRSTMCNSPGLPAKGPLPP